MANDSLFKTFSRNLSLYKPEYQDVFLCPLQVSPKCRKLYSYENISLLNKAHTWQRSLGGKQVTLTCQECNGFIGKHLEPHASNHAKFVKLDKLPFKMSYEGVEGSEGGKVGISTEEGIPELKFEIEWSNPSTRAAVKKLHDAGTPPQMEVAILSGFEERRVSLTYLHFAYLYLFHEYGYEWFYSDFAYAIRHQLRHPEEQTFETPYATIEPHLQKVRPDSAWHFFTTQPHDLRGLQVVSPQLSYQDKWRVVVFFSLAQPNIHNSKTPSVLPPDYVAELRPSVLVPSHSVHEQLDNQKWLFNQASQNVQSLIES